MCRNPVTGIPVSEISLDFVNAVITVFMQVWKYQASTDSDPYEVGTTAKQNTRTAECTGVKQSSDSFISFLRHNPLRIL